MRSISVIQRDNDVLSKFVEAAPAICDVFRKFDGKKVTKRIDTAVREILPSFYLKIEQGFHAGTKEISFNLYDNCCHEYFGSIVCDSEHFDATAAIERIEQSAEYRANQIAKFNEALPNIEKMMEEYNAAREAFIAIRKSIPHDIREALNIKDEYISTAYISR